MAETMVRKNPAEDERRQRLIEALRAPSKKIEEDYVYVWPNLVVLEFVAAAVFTITFLITSVLVNAPLLDHANPERTPNPSKAPWYFLNLQELLLHMDPMWAGVLVPAIALLGLAAIPFIDNSPKGVGIYFTSQAGKKIAIFSAIYAAFWNIFLILVDSDFEIFFGGGVETPSPIVTSPKKLMVGLKTIHPDLGPFIFNLVTGHLFPLALIALLIIIQIIIMRRVWKANTREVMIGLFTGFFVTYFVLTIVGTAFRGIGQHLVWPWQVPPEMLR